MDVTTDLERRVAEAVAADKALYEAKRAVDDAERHRDRAMQALEIALADATLSRATKAPQGPAPCPRPPAGRNVA